MTLKTAQETFDHVLNHLRKQGVAALGKSRDPEDGDDPVCRYRTPEGLSCAAGCLIPDAAYHPMIEGQGVRYLTSYKPGTDSGVTGALLDALTAGGVADHLNLVADMQRAHDGELAANCEDHLKMPRWERAMERIAGDNNLVYTPKSPA